jgi:hypothetical protein
VRKAFELAVAVFHLVVLGVEDHALLDLVTVCLRQDVFSDRQLFDAKVSFKSVSYCVAASLPDSAVEYLQFLNRFVPRDKM